MIFRPRARTVAARELPFLVLAIVAVVLTYLFGDGVWVPTALAVTGIVMLISWKRYLPAWTSSIRVDRDGIAGKLPGGEFAIVWPDVLMAQLESDDESTLLHLATAADSFGVPVTDFDVSGLWREVQSRVPPRALHPEAYRDLPGYADWAASQSTLTMATLRVKDARWASVVCWGGLIFFGACGVLSVLADVSVALIAFGPLSLASLLGVVQGGETIVDPDGVTRRTRLGAYRLSWDAVRRIEISPNGDGLALHAGERRLVLPGPIYWSSEHREALTEILMAHWKEREITVEESARAAFLWSRGTKVAWKMARRGDIGGSDRLHDR